jgi:hypothetical protein
MMAVWAETCSKLYNQYNSFYTGDVNEFLIIVVLWRIKKGKFYEFVWINI